MFVIPIHYLVLYLYWQYNDIKHPNLNNISSNYNKSNAYLELIKYILITNPFFILISCISLYSKLIDKFSLFDIFITVIFALLLVSLVFFYLYKIIKLLIKSVKFLVEIIIKSD